MQQVEFQATVTIPAKDVESFCTAITGGKPDGITGAGRHCGDVLLPSFSGYWACGVEFERGKGWLVYDQEEGARDDGPRDEDAAVRAWEHGDPLPRHFYSFDRALAEKALRIGVAKHGRLYVDQDYSQNDAWLQEALFGEVRYG